MGKKKNQKDGASFLSEDFQRGRAGEDIENTKRMREALESDPRKLQIELGKPFSANRKTYCS